MKGWLKGTWGKQVEEERDMGGSRLKKKGWLKGSWGGRLRKKGTWWRQVEDERDMGEAG